LMSARFATQYSLRFQREFVGFNCAVLPHAAGFILAETEGGTPNAV